GVDEGPQADSHELVVVDQEHPDCHYLPPKESSAVGRTTRKEAPPPGRSSTQARPPWSSAKRATAHSPMPVRPGPSRAVRNSSKIGSFSSSGTPAPPSSTTITTALSSTW